MCPDKVERVLRDYPHLQLCIPHLGLDEFEAYAALFERYDNLWLDTTMMLADYVPCFVCYEVDFWPSPWSKRCFQQADQGLLVEDAAAPQPGILEMTLLRLGDEQSLVQHTLVLIHPDGSQAPTSTSRWLAPRYVTRHYHLRRDYAKDQIGLWQYHPACPTPGRRTPRSQEPASGSCIW